MNYEYEIARIEPKQGFMRVVYRVEGYPDIHQNIGGLVDFTESGILEAVDARAGIVSGILERMDAAPESPAIPAGAKGNRQWNKPVPPTPPIPTQAELVARKLEEISFVRNKVEEGGILWTDSNGKTFGFGTDVESQAKFSAAVAQAAPGKRRVNTDVWKCMEYDEVGDATLRFRPTTNAELLAVSDFVFDHIQKCFNVEAVCFEKVMQGDLTVDFATEFAAY